ncbi:MAG TPA: M14 family metallopeptidase [Actinomycetota bacterium]|nr:M14 family metallopeptidase [Actinomycetota bacterium]
MRRSTNFDVGGDGEKPALWLDANIHADEVTGCTAALHLIHHLLSGHGRDPRITAVLDTRAFYIVPRLNPDGAELALADRPRFVRSSVRAYPFPHRRKGLHQEDVDGDGRILMMRMEDPNGAWKAHSEQARLMVRREPDEPAEDGTFYRIFPEGTLEGYDGVSVRVAEPLEGLDLNRNYPMEWSPESEQSGAGPFPASEPEVRAMVEAVVARPNITAHITYHTFSGVHLRPYSSHPDDHFPTKDLAAYKLIGERATAITGYPSASVFHDFKYDPKSTIKGGADDWSYEHLGVFSWTTEFWSPQRRAGITDFHLIEWFKEHSVEDDLKLLAWNDEELSGRGYIDWYPCEHPQLGPVELGGWDLFYCWVNPPPEFLEQEIAPHSEFAVYHLLISPRLELQRVEVERLGASTYRLAVVVENTGFLPTNVTAKAVERKVCPGVEVELTLPADARRLTGEEKAELGQLGGRVTERSLLSWFDADEPTDRTKAEWVIEAPRGGQVRIEARHPRAGVARRTIALG